MIEQWEEFPSGPRDQSDYLHVTLNRKGEILVGANTFSKMGEPMAVALLYDKVNSKIGLMPVNPRTQNAWPLKSKAKNNYRLISASRFCRHHNIKVDRTTAFLDTKINEEKILVLDLSRTIGVGKR